MIRYYFDVICNGVEHIDAVGREFQTFDEAKTFSERAYGEIHRLEFPTIPEHQFIRQIRDENGTRVILKQEQS